MPWTFAGFLLQYNSPVATVNSSWSGSHKTPQKKKDVINLANFPGTSQHHERESVPTPEHKERWWDFYETCTSTHTCSMHRQPASSKYCESHITQG